MRVYFKLCLLQGCLPLIQGIQMLPFGFAFFSIIRDLHGAIASPYMALLSSRLVKQALLGLDSM